MPIVPFKNIEHVIYEHLTEKKLIAIEKAESKKIAEFEKLNKSKKQKEKQEEHVVDRFERFEYAMEIDLAFAND